MCKLINLGIRSWSLESKVMASAVEVRNVAACTLQKKKNGFEPRVLASWVYMNPEMYVQLFEIDAWYFRITLLCLTSALTQVRRIKQNYQNILFREKEYMLWIVQAIFMSNNFYRYKAKKWRRKTATRCCIFLNSFPLVYLIEMYLLDRREEYDTFTKTIFACFLLRCLQVIE